MKLSVVIQRTEIRPQSVSSLRPDNKLDAAEAFLRY
jgi:hypothetical protein